jgi:transcriptional regulator with XRE-family HTH domain
MRFREAIGEVVREKRLAKGKPMRFITEKGFISLGHISEVERGMKEPSSEIIEKIADGLGVPSYELILEAGLKMYRDSVPEVLYVPDRTAWAEQYSDLIRT